MPFLHNIERKVSTVPRQVVQATTVRHRHHHLPRISIAIDRPLPRPILRVVAATIHPWPVDRPCPSPRVLNDRTITVRPHLEEEEELR